MRDRSTQTKLLQEPPTTLEEAVLVAQRFEAANSMIATLRAEATTNVAWYTQNRAPIGAVSSGQPTMTCFGCGGFGHMAKNCPSIVDFKRRSNVEKTCFICSKPGHLARDCFHGGSRQKLHVQNAPPRQPPTCFHCGCIDHISRYCQEKQELPKEAVGQRQGKHFGQNDKNKIEKEYKIRLTAVSPLHQRKVLLVEAKINGQSKLCIVETGASIYLISKDVWESLKSNDAPIGILGKVNLLLELNEAHKTHQEFYVANEVISEVILGLDWLINNKVTIHTANLLLKFPDLTHQPLTIYDASLKDPFFWCYKTCK
ncbi:uncharacterized protein LOC135690257 [Rhopilema esculentum]|uniref:uncharacterized protein LOC135690257 n=1 Tax=Rhopilema esculentum TaxID=499914 RepID=UPI0031DC1D8B